MKFDKLVLLSVALCAVVLIGEFAAYGYDAHRYDANAEFGGGIIELNISSSGADTYSVMVIDNDGTPPITTLYIYLDETYDRFFEDADGIVNLKRIDLEYCIEQITVSLKVRGFDDVVVVNADKLAEMIKDDPASKGLLMLSYALPESVYAGLSGDPIFDWLRKGGSLYWACSPIGMFYVGNDSLNKVENSSTLFFGKEFVNIDGPDLALSRSSNEKVTDALYLKWNRVMFGLNATEIEGAFSMGYQQDGFSSVTMVPFEDGMVCVIGGNYERNTCDDISQIIASRISCHSEVTEIIIGTVRRGTVEETINVTEENNVSLYVSIGGYYTVYGRALIDK